MRRWMGRVNSESVTALFKPEADYSIELAQKAALMLGDGDILVLDTAEALPGHELPNTSIELLAKANSPLARVIEVLSKQGLNPFHTDICENEAKKLLENPGLDSSDLEDLTKLPFVTIDNEDSKDLDQALFLETHGSEHIRIFYALADAAYYVRPGTALFSEAIQRAVTYYVPGMSVPMLPRSLSEDLVSLNPGVKRRALLFRITIDVAGEVLETDVSRALIKSQAKLSYTGVQQFYDCVAAHKPHPYSETTFSESLLHLMEAGRRRIAHAEQRDVVDYNRMEPSVTLYDGQTQQSKLVGTRSQGFSIKLRERVGCEKYNEQISLLCNMEGAQLLQHLAENHSATQPRKQEPGMEKEQLNPVLQSIFRIHSPPLEKRLGKLRETLDQLADAHQLPDTWRWQAGQSLSDYVAALPDTDPNVSVTAEVQTPNRHPLSLAIERMILLTNRASFFSEEPGPHHALGVTAYARFSSPMREMAGIFTHKELLEALGLEKTSKNSNDEFLQETIIAAANAAKKTQKKLDQEFHLMAIENYLNQDLSLEISDRPIRRGTIMGMRSGKIYVNINGFGGDIKLYLDDLDKHFGCRYRVGDVTAVAESKQNGNSYSVSSNKLSSNTGANPPVLKIGDSINLMVTNYEPGNRRYVLIPV